MEDIKLRFADAIAARLTGAPDSPAKSELVEELADNLYQRYLDLTAAGTEPEEAFSLAMEDLGDMDELLEYLNSGVKDEGPARETGDPFENLMRDVEEIARAAFDVTRNALDELRQGFRPSRGRQVYVDLEKNGTERAEHPYREDGEPGSESSRSFPAAGLRAVELENLNGDISVSFYEPEDGDVVIGGKLAMLEIVSTPGGTLSVRRRQTASAESMLRLGLGRTDIELSLPQRDWNSIRAATANGDAEIEGRIRAEKIDVRTANGDIRVEVDGCGQLQLESASGDVSFSGDCGGASVKSASGDLRFTGSASVLKCGTMSGDVDFDGTAGELRCSSMSGDVSIELRNQPAALEATSKSGDCSVRLPGEREGSFSARLGTVSGDVNSTFPISRISGRNMIAYCGSGGSEYSISSVSGDINLIQV